MTCYHPLTAYSSLTQKTDSGKQLITFSQDLKDEASTEIAIPCGQCIGCRLRRSRDWATRCYHEASERENSGQSNCFLTLTFNKESLPLDLSVDIRDLQLFIKRLRTFNNRKEFHLGKGRYEDRSKNRKANQISFYACGEYGEECKECGYSRHLCRCRRFKKAIGRAHYHLLIFGFDFQDKQEYEQNGEFTWYTSVTLETLWPFGRCIIGQLTWQSAAYCARYATKKINGKRQKKHYRKTNKRTGEILHLVPEFATMSRRPAIGKSWARTFYRDLYPNNRLQVEKRNVEVPRYYDRMVAEFQPELVDEAKERRQIEADKHQKDQTARRLRDREQVKLAQYSQLLRRLEA